MRTVRLVLKQHRFDVIVLALATLAVTLATAYTALRLGALPDEITRCPDPATCTALRAELERLTGIVFSPLVLIAVVIPIFAGVIFGVPIVAREVERGTASMPWTMSRSRHGWFLRRVAILGGTLVALALLPSFALEWVFAATYPGTDLAFQYADARGPIVAARALTTFGLAALAGALMGRVLPAVLLAIAGSAALFVGLQILDDSWLTSEAVVLADDPNEQTQSLVVGIGFVLPDGRVVDWQAAYDSIGDPDRYPEEVYGYRYLGVPAELAMEKRAREIGVILAAGLACVLAATVVVNRRRPY